MAEMNWDSNMEAYIDRSRMLAVTGRAMTESEEHMREIGCSADEIAIERFNDWDYGMEGVFPIELDPERVGSFREVDAENEVTGYDGRRISWNPRLSIWE